jgi:carbonic anhydrase
MIDLGQTGPGTRWSRRGLVAGLAGMAMAGGAMAGRALAAGHAEEGAAPTPAEAEKRLMAGNARYVVGAARHPDQTLSRRASLVGGQKPFATILACADSRVGPELVFDQGLGDLFVIRVAGNVVDDVVLGSIEYSVVHLGVPLVMVLGHEHCGAVAAAADAVAKGASPEDKDTKIVALAGLIVPAVQAVPAGAPDKVEAAVLLNAQRAARAIVTDSAAVRERVKAGRLRVVSARYGLSNGKVSEIRAAEA